MKLFKFKVFIYRRKAYREVANIINYYQELLNLPIVADLTPKPMIKIKIQKFSIFAKKKHQNFTPIPYHKRREIKLKKNN